MYSSKPVVGGNVTHLRKPMTLPFRILLMSHSLRLLAAPRLVTKTLIHRLACLDIGEMLSIRKCFARNYDEFFNHL